MEEFEITTFADYLVGNYGDQLTAHHGDVHDYLVIDLDYSEKRKVKVSMIKYLTNLLQEFP